MLTFYQRRLADDGSLTLTVRVRPNARTTRVVEVLEDGSLKVDLHAAPEDGEANEELVQLLADSFDVGVSRIEILSGHTGRRKTVRITR